MEKIQIQGKDYIQVNERIKEFRSLHPLWTIDSFLIKIDDVACIIQTHIKDESGRVIATGMAREKDGDGFINKTSFVENCETSAVGRALGMLGIGIDTSVASYEEVANAQLNQSTTINKVFGETKPTTTQDNCPKCGGKMTAGKDGKSSYCYVCWKKDKELKESKTFNYTPSKTIEELPF
jgi:hypothetical protein